MDDCRHSVTFLLDQGKSEFQVLQSHARRSGLYLRLSFLHPKETPTRRVVLIVERPRKKERSGWKNLKQVQLLGPCQKALHLVVRVMLGMYVYRQTDRHVSTDRKTCLHIRAATCMCTHANSITLLKHDSHVCISCITTYKLNCIYAHCIPTH